MPKELILRLLDTSNQEISRHEGMEEVLGRISLTSVVYVKLRSGAGVTGCLPTAIKHIDRYGLSNGYKESVVLLHHEPIENEELTGLISRYKVMPWEDVAEVTQWPERECTNSAFVHLERG